MSASNSSPLNQQWLTALQESGYRVTGPRRAIVEIMGSSPRALSPLEVFDLGRKDYPSLGLVTVYRTLEKMEQLGLIQRIHQPVGCHMYMRAAHGHEHLLVCTSCGQACYFEGDELSRLIESVSKETGFAVQEHWLQLFGLCPSCQ